MDWTNRDLDSEIQRFLNSLEGDPDITKLSRLIQERDGTTKGVVTVYSEDSVRLIMQWMSNREERRVNFWRNVACMALYTLGIVFTLLAVNHYFKVR